LSVPTVKNLKFPKSKMAAAAQYILKQCQITSVLFHSCGCIALAYISPLVYSYLQLVVC